jgi:hypothetical protein
VTDFSQRRIREKTGWMKIYIIIILVEMPTTKKKKKRRRRRKKNTTGARRGVWRIIITMLHAALLIITSV